jgi:eukaryotic-like serine/threonine-protein kinase
MKGVTQPVVTKPAQTAAEDAVREWLDVLANGECSQSLFLQAMQDRFQSEPDGNWEVLSQLDQYFRRGKIKSEVFLAVKTALAGRALGASNDRIAHVIAAGGAGSEPIDLKKPPVTAGPELRLGDVLRGRYRIESILGQGGMGTVFEAVDAYRLEVPPSGQRLAIKVLHSAVTLRAELLTELRREFQHLQLLSHPNIVRVYEFERDGPLAFFTMELLSGVLLSRVLQARKRAPLERAHALAVVRDVGAAIAHAHSRGVVHGDINPQNIFITVQGEIRVLDFGASHRLIAAPAMLKNGATPAAFATPGYASCQVLEGQRPDVRDDVFALACVAYLLFCGTHPFPQSTAVEARAARVIARRPSNLTGQQWRALRAGLAWEREKRPDDLHDWLDQLNLGDAAKSLPALSDLLEPPALKARKSLAPVLLITLALALGGAYWFFRQQEALPTISSLLEAEVNPRIEPAPTRAPTAKLPDAPTAALPPAPPSARPSAAARVDSPPPAAAAAPTRPALPVPGPIAGTTIWPARIEMAADIVDVPYPAGSAQVVVRRKDNMRSGIGFTWWTESGTAKPGKDFVAVVPRVELFQDGKPSITLNIPLIDAPRAQPKSFYVVIDDPSGEAKLGSRALTMVTLPPTSSQ